MVLPRTRLLARLTASEPRLIGLSAPPGYGKSWVTRLFARRYDRHAFCDCLGVDGVVGFANRAMSALAAESQGNGDAIAASRLRLHATEADPATWSRALLDAWKARPERALFILESADALSGNGDVLALLGDMLAARPSERVLLISSHQPLPLRISHYLAPHQILTLARDELRFDSDEAAGIFEGTDLAPELVDRIVRLADGWPISLLLLARFAHYDADVEKLIDRLDRVAFANLHEYLANEVLTALTPDMMSTMVATAAIPYASLEDISAATGIRHITPVVDGLLRLPGFISSEAGVFQTHPVLREALRARHGSEFSNCLGRAARENERLGDFLRAAELYTLDRDFAAAARALDRLPATTLQAPSSRLVDALAHIDVPILCEYPNLWVLTLRERREHVEASRLYDEGARLLRAISPEASPALHRRLRVWLAMLAQELEQLAEARALAEASESFGSFDEAPEEQRLVLMTSAIIAAKQGRFADSDRFVEESDAAQGARHLRFEGERAQIAAERMRLLGDWYGVLKMSEEALQAAQRSGITSRIIFAARAVASAAWYCDDDAHVTAAQQMLKDCGDLSVREFAACVDAALAGRAIHASDRVAQLARWHAALITTDIERAKELFDRAIEGMDAAENDFLRIAVRVSTALLLPLQRRRLLEARVIAQRIESPPLQASLELLVDSPEPLDYGIFRYIAARVGKSPLKVRRDVLLVDVVRGEVRRGAELLHVSHRGFELLAALALLPAEMSKEDLAAAIWPGLDGEAALNALKMCVSRVRAQVADKQVIRRTRHGYTLGEEVATDVRQFERLLRSIRGAEGFGASSRRQVQEAVRALGARRRALTGEWAWFGPHEARLELLHAELALASAKEPFRRDETSGADFEEQLLDR